MLYFICFFSYLDGNNFIPNLKSSREEGCLFDEIICVLLLFLALFFFFLLYLQRYLLPICSIYVRILQKKKKDFTLFIIENANFYALTWTRTINLSSLKSKLQNFERSKETNKRYLLLKIAPMCRQRDRQE
jgi:hypothetical protein